jgi:quercetin dioxygenase-like cupin family protein
VAWSADKPTAATGQATIWTADEGEWMPLPDIFPPGGQFKVINGDPAKGPVDLYMRFPGGYVAPWHFHTPIEKVLMNHGTMKFEVRGGQTATIADGGYVDIPSRLPHRVTCTSSGECVIYLVSSDAFDIHRVDDQWNVTQSWSAAAAAAHQTSRRQ